MRPRHADSSHTRNVDDKHPQIGNDRSLYIHRKASFVQLTNRFVVKYTLHILPKNSPMSEPKHTIHIRIRDLRRERSLTQEELAVALGLSRQSINAMEAGRCLPSLPVAMQIATYFSVPLGTVFAVSEEIAQHMQLQQQVDPTFNSLVPWVPLREIREVLGALGQETPAANTWEDELYIHVEIRLPGYRSGDLDIEVGPDFVSVSGDRLQNLTESRTYIHQEYTIRAFQRTVQLSVPVLSEETDAEMRNGILHIQLSKIIEQKIKTSRIQARSAE